MSIFQVVYVIIIGSLALLITPIAGTIIFLNLVEHFSEIVSVFLMLLLLEIVIGLCLFFKFKDALSESSEVKKE